MAQGASDIRAGGAFWEMFLKDQLSPALEKAKKNIQQFGALVKKVSLGAGVGAAAITAPLTALFKGGVDRGAELARLEKQLGLPLEALHRMQYAADAAGVSLDEVMNDWQGRYSSLIDRAPSIDVDSAREAASAQLELSDATRSLQLALLPLVQIVGRYVKALSEWVKNNSGTAQTVLAVGLGVVAFAAAVKLLSVAFSVLAPVATLAWGAVTGPIGLLALCAAAGAALGTVLFGLTDDFKGVRDTVATLGDIFGKAFGGIKDALAKADIKLAWQILVQSLKVLWLEFVDSANMVWTGFKLTFLGTWDKAIAALKIAWNNFTGWLDKSLNAVVDGFLAVMSRALRASPAPGSDRLAAGIDRMRGTLSSDATIDARTRAKNSAALEEAEQKQRNRVQDLLADRGELAAAKAERDRLLGIAAKPDAKKDNPFDGTGPLKQGLLGAVQVKGAFSGAAIGQQLGFADQTVKQIELLKQLNNGEGQLPEKIAGAIKQSVAGGFATVR